MNFLAHAYLSFDDPGTMVGNLISDFVKGRKQFDYPPEIRGGITLHRIIDTYTDEHEATKNAKQIFRPFYRLYSGAFVDVIYDHFLALDENEFPNDRLFDFSQQAYSHLDQHLSLLPPRFAQMFPYMKSQNWLYNYKTILGTERSLSAVVRRATYLTNDHEAIKLFAAHYQPLKECYRQFWSDLKPFAYNQFLSIKNAGNKL